MRLEHYQIRVYYSDEDKVWFAEAVRESILEHGATPQEALERVVKLIPDYERTVIERDDGDWPPRSVVKNKGGGTLDS